MKNHIDQQSHCEVHCGLGLASCTAAWIVAEVVESSMPPIPIEKAKQVLSGAVKVTVCGHIRGS